MERTLTQEEIEAMLRAARASGGGKESVKEHHSIEPWTFRHSGQLSAEQVRAISALHEGFARSLSQSLGAYLNVPFEASLAAVEQLAYGQFLERVPEVAYMASFQVSPTNVSGAVQIDNALVFPLIDILLGGTGHCEVLAREVSEIEAQIMKEVVKIICRELSETWTSLGIQVEMEAREPRAQMLRFLPSIEKILCMSFEIKLAESRGKLNLICVSNPLLRKLTAEASEGARAPKRSAGKLKERLLDCPFPVVLAMTSIEVSIYELLGLSAGDVCNLHVPVKRPASVVIAGREVFAAQAVRSTRQRAAQIGEPLVISDEGEKS